jgi:N utilization substance protein B
MARRSKSDEIEQNHARIGDESIGRPPQVSCDHTENSESLSSKKAHRADKVLKDESDNLAPQKKHADDVSQDVTVEEESVSKKREERSLIFHLLYAAEGFEYQESLEAIADNFNRGFEQNIAIDSPVFKMAQAVIQDREMLDEAITPFLANWRFERLSVCTKLILRMAFWELLNTDNPPVVVINEAIELTKCFAEADAYRFVNGVLDGFVKKRAQEQEVAQ